MKGGFFMHLPPSHPLRTRVRAALIRELGRTGVITSSQQERLLALSLPGEGRP